MQTTASHASEHATWQQMESVGESIAPRLADLVPLLVNDSTRESDFAAWVGVDATVSSDLIVVDMQWNLLAFAGDPERLAVLGLRVGEPVDWVSQDYLPESKTVAGELPGKLLLASGTHVAIAFPLPEQLGYVITHYPFDTLAAAAAAQSAAPAITAITFLWTCVLMGIAAFVVLSRHDAAVAHRKPRTASDTLGQAQKLIRTRDAVIFGLAKLAESRDPETGGHLDRMSIYCTTLASALHRELKYCRTVTPSFVRLIGIGSALHDIGKVGIEDRILLKPGPLTADERREMEKHTIIGGDCLRQIEQRLGSSNFLHLAQQIAISHHEHWNGGGYPYGVSGKDIPLVGRIAAIADVYDALSTKRVYKDAFSHEKCVEIIRQGAGKQFDPQIVEIWLTIQSKFRDIAAQLSPDAGTIASQQPEWIGEQGESECDDAKERPLAGLANGRS